MDLGAAVIAAGFGLRRGAAEGDLAEALARALIQAGHSPYEVISLFAPARRRGERGLASLSRRAGLPLTFLDEADLAPFAAHTLTVSSHSLAHTGLSSVAETCALRGAGEGSVLLAPRIAFGAATCALARPRGAP